MGRFNKGLFFGSLFGAGLTWLAVTKKGKEVRGQLLDHMAVVYVEVKEKILSQEEWQKISQTEFVKRVEEIVARYGGAKKISRDVQRMIVKVVGSQYKTLKKIVQTQPQKPTNRAKKSRS